MYGIYNITPNPNPTHNINANKSETNQSSISFNPFSKNFGMGLNLAITFPRINASGTGP